MRSGVYTATFALPGFSTVRREGIELRANFTATIDAEMKVGTVEETITVTGAAPVVDVRTVAPGNVLSRAVVDSIPTGKSIAAWAALTPAAVTPANSMDVGGSKGEQALRMVVHGSRPTEQRLAIDGMHIGAGAGIEFYFIPNPLTAQEVVVGLGGSAAEYPQGGAQINFIPKDGGNTHNGSLFSAFTNESLQGNNVSDEILARGLSTSSINKVQEVWDLDGAIGGPLRKDRLWFYTGARWWGSHTTVADRFHERTGPGVFTYQPDLSRPGIDDNDFWTGSVRLTWQASQKHKLTAYFERQGGCQCHTNLRTALVTPEAADMRKSKRNDVPQATWTYIATNRLMLQAKAGGRHYKYAIELQPGVTPDTITVLEQSNGLRHFAVTNFGNVDTAYFGEALTMAYVTGSHSFKTGVSLEQKSLKAATGPTQGIRYTFRNGVPISLEQEISPLVREGSGGEFNLFAQDQWTLGRVTLNLGLRMDGHTAEVPPQHLPATRWSAAKDFDSVDCVPCWIDLSPRLAAAYDLFGNGKTALKVNFGRFVGVRDLGRAVTQLGLTPTTASANPVQALVWNATRSWNDINGNFIPDCNFSLPGASGECGPLSDNQFGQNRGTRRFDPELLDGFNIRDHNWQTAVIVQHELLPRLAVDVGYCRTAWQNFSVQDNQLITPQDFNPYCITTPGDSRLPGGGGQQICGLYDITPAKFGQASDILITDAAHYGEQRDTYNGVDITVNGRFAGGALLGGGVNMGRTETNACFVVDSPQQLHFCNVKPPFVQPQIKLHGVVPLPGAFQVSAIFQSLPGLPITANFSATTEQIAPSLGRPLAGGTRTVTIPIIQPGTMFEGRPTQLDLRVTRNFRFGGKRLQANVDVYNVLNANPVLGVNATYGTAWLRPTEILGARLLKFSAQLDF